MWSVWETYLAFSSWFWIGSGCKKIKKPVFLDQDLDQLLQRLGSGFCCVGWSHYHVHSVSYTKDLTPLDNSLETHSEFLKVVLPDILSIEKVLYCSPITASGQMHNLLKKGQKKMGNVNILTVCLFKK